MNIILSIIIIFIVILICTQIKSCNTNYINEMYTDFKKLKDKILEQKIRQCKFAKHENKTPNQTESENNNFMSKYLNEGVCSIESIM